MAANPNVGGQPNPNVARNGVQGALNRARNAWRGARQGFANNGANAGTPNVAANPAQPRVSAEPLLNRPDSEIIDVLDNWGTNRTDWARVHSATEMRAQQVKTPRNTNLEKKILERAAATSSEQDKSIHLKETDKVRHLTEAAGQVLEKLAQQGTPNVTIKRLHQEGSEAPGSAKILSKSELLSVNGMRDALIVPDIKGRPLPYNAETYAAMRDNANVVADAVYGAPMAQKLHDSIKAGLDDRQIRALQDAIYGHKLGGRVLGDPEHVKEMVVSAVMLRLLQDLHSPDSDGKRTMLSEDLEALANGGLDGLLQNDGANGATLQQNFEDILRGVVTAYAFSPDAPGRNKHIEAFKKNGANERELPPDAWIRRNWLIRKRPAVWVAGKLGLGKNNLSALKIDISGGHTDLMQFVESPSNPMPYKGILVENDPLSHEFNQRIIEHLNDQSNYHNPAEVFSRVLQLKDALATSGVAPLQRINKAFELMNQVPPPRTEAQKQVDQILILTLEKDLMPAVQLKILDSISAKLPGTQYDALRAKLDRLTSGDLTPDQVIALCENLLAVAAVDFTNPQFTELRNMIGALQLPVLITELNPGGPNNEHLGFMLMVQLLNAKDPAGYGRVLSNFDKMILGAGPINLAGDALSQSLLSNRLKALETPQPQDIITWLSAVPGLTGDFNDSSVKQYYDHFLRQRARAVSMQEMLHLPPDQQPEGMGDLIANEILPVVNRARVNPTDASIAPPIVLTWEEGNRGLATAESAADVHNAAVAAAAANVNNAAQNQQQNQNIPHNPNALSTEQLAFAMHAAGENDVGGCLWALPKKIGGLIGRAIVWGTISSAVGLAATAVGLTAAPAIIGGVALVAGVIAGWRQVSRSRAQGASGWSVALGAVYGFGSAAASATAFMVGGPVTVIMTSLITGTGREAISGILGNNGRGNKEARAHAQAYFTALQQRMEDLTADQRVELAQTLDPQFDETRFRAMTDARQADSLFGQLQRTWQANMPDADKNGRFQAFSNKIQEFNDDTNARSQAYVQAQIDLAGQDRDGESGQFAEWEGRKRVAGANAGAFMGATTLFQSAAGLGMLAYNNGVFGALKDFVQDHIPGSAPTAADFLGNWSPSAEITTSLHNIPGMPPGAHHVGDVFSNDGGNTHWAPVSLDGDNSTEVWVPVQEVSPGHFEVVPGTNWSDIIAGEGLGFTNGVAHPVVTTPATPIGTPETPQGFDWNNMPPRYTGLQDAQGHNILTPEHVTWLEQAGLTLRGDPNALRIKDIDGFEGLWMRPGTPIGDMALQLMRQNPTMDIDTAMRQAYVDVQQLNS